MKTRAVLEVAKLLSHAKKPFGDFSGYSHDELQAGLGLWLVRSGAARPPVWFHPENNLTGERAAQWLEHALAVGRKKLAPILRECRDEVITKRVTQLEIAVTAIQALVEGTPLPVAIVAAQILLRGMEEARKKTKAAGVRTSLES